eukprot:14052173-Ditylum_brightwellii.AAC.1
MITAPALGEFTREVDKFHKSKNSKTSKCDLTFTARKKLITAVDNEVGRNFTHYLLITPPDCFVDNQIFG